MDDSCSSVDDGGCSWRRLGRDPQLSIMSVLKQLEEKCSLQAVMQTSRDLQLLGSSLISSIQVRDAFALAHYPRHAAAITTMRLMMRPDDPEDAHMGLPCMVTWLQATSTACNRLTAVNTVRVELPKSGADFETLDPAVMGSLLASIGRACPDLRRLRIDGINRADGDLIRAMFSAIGQHLPGIVELRLELDLESHEEAWDFNLAGIDWAACLPRGLQKFRSSIHLHQELLQQLVQMPSLAEVAVLTLGFDTTEVQSGGCAWRTLRTECFPLCQSIGRFTVAMPLLQLLPLELHSDFQIRWHLDCRLQWLASHAESPAVAKAAAWLSQIRNCPKVLSIGWTFGIPGAESSKTAGVISALAPLSGLASLVLEHWPITESTLDDLVQALPNVSKLTLSSCSISSGAWSRMSSLMSVTDLCFAQSPDRIAAVDPTIPLAQIIALASAILHPMALTLGSGCVSPADQAGWEAIKDTLEEQRRNKGLPQISVHISG